MANTTCLYCISLSNILINSLALSKCYICCVLVCISAILIHWKLWLSSVDTNNLFNMCKLQCLSFSINVSYTATFVSLICERTHVEMCKQIPETELVCVVHIIDSVPAAFQHNKVMSKGVTPFSSAAEQKQCPPGTPLLIKSSISNSN